jgi:hypothetical protein
VLVHVVTGEAEPTSNLRRVDQLATDGLSTEQLHHALGNRVHGVIVKVNIGAHCAVPLGATVPSSMGVLAPDTLVSDSA